MTTTTTLPKGKTIQTKTPEQFHQLRSKGIGASEISAILGIDPYMTPFKLWQKKTGRLDRDPDNMFTRAGHKLENAVAEYFEEESGNHVILNCIQAVASRVHTRSRVRNPRCFRQGLRIPSKATATREAPIARQGVPATRLRESATAKVANEK